MDTPVIMTPRRPRWAPGPCCRLVGEVGLVKEALLVRRASADLYFILLPWVFSPALGTGRILREYLLIEYEKAMVPWSKN